MISAARRSWTSCHEWKVTNGRSGMEGQEWKVRNERQGRAVRDERSGPRQASLTCPNDFHFSLDSHVPRNE